MKKLMTLAVLMTIAISAHAMSYSQAQSEALFLSDKMAYELNLSPEQYEAVYEINFDYFYSVGHRRDIFGTYWSRRDSDLRYVLSTWQYNQYVALTYFYHPLSWTGGTFRFAIYTRYADRNHFFRARPTRYTTYRGGFNRGASRYRGRSFNPPAAPRTGQHVGQPTGSFNHGRPSTSGSTSTNRPRTSGGTSTNRPRTSGGTGSNRPRTSGGTGSTTRPSSSGTARPSSSGTSRQKPSGSHGTTSSSKGQRSFGGHR